MGVEGAARREPGQATVIDGKAHAARLRGEVARAVEALRAEHGVTPGLAVILVGAHPASQVYVANKGAAAREAGLRSVERRLPEDVSEADLLAEINALNADDTIHGVLVQLPLPPQIDTDRVIDAIDPAKDVDGFHSSNVGALSLGRAALTPCTPLGCMMLLRGQLGDLTGRDALVIGRSNIVGKPMAQLLLKAGATVTVAHSRTKDLPALARRAELLVAAVGRPEMVRGDWIRPGAVVVDVGINRIDAPERGFREDGAPKTRLVGDVAFEEARAVAGAVTPVPGGVGPMTIACLLRNTVSAARARLGLELEF
ncbi:MAG: bifunctional methylenetetrahydrofolate dehydrogenase/methenyltetrahydrofolate cyclohydrolase FolD [Pseudomonadota bacterium]